MDNGETKNQLGKRFAKFSTIIEEISREHPGKNNFRSNFRSSFNEAFKARAGNNAGLINALMYVSKLLQEIAYAHLKMNSSQTYCQADADLMLLIFEIDSDSSFYLPFIIKIKSIYAEDPAILSKAQKALGDNLNEVIEISKKVIDEM